ncbi:MAG: hypothetical protein ACK4L4_12820 [Gemmobacter sp.]
MRVLDPYLDPQVQAAALAGFFLACGWVVNGWQNRRRDAALREERVRDVLRSLYSEIRAYLAVLRRDDVGVYGADLCARILAEPGFFPIIPTERNDTMFRAVVDEIHVLPDAVIHSVVLYYSQVVAIETIIADLRGLDHAKVGQRRAAGIYRDYIGLKIEAVELGAKALADIAEELQFPLPPEAEALDGWLARQWMAVSNRAVDPSDP